MRIFPFSHKSMREVGHFLVCSLRSRLQTKKYSASTPQWHTYSAMAKYSAMAHVLRNGKLRRLKDVLRNGTRVCHCGVHLRVTRHVALMV